MSSRSDGLRWWQYIGPWPLRPWIGFWGAGAVNLIAGLSVQRADVTAHPLVEVPRILLPIVLGATAFALYLALVGRVLTARTPRHISTYLAIIIGGTVIAAVVTFAVNRGIGLASSEQARYLPFQAFRMSIWTVFLLGVAGLTVRRLSRQTEIAQQALAVSLEQQSLMLVNEERSRRQIALLLHDRVQAGLMTACLELRMSIAPDAEVDRARIDSIISRLDDLRGLDVRQAARTLSPDLSNVDLHTALRELARVYEPGMQSNIDIAASITNSASAIAPDALLACYRIFEQGLLNAVVHGQATQCQVTLRLDAAGTLELELRDNGRGIAPGNRGSGFGSAIIDSWCRVLGGSWSLVNVSTGGAVLTARLPVVGPTGGASEAWPLR